MADPWRAKERSPPPESWQNLLPDTIWMLQTISESTAAGDSSRTYWRILQRSPDPLAGEDGAGCPVPRTLPPLRPYRPRRPLTPQPKPPDHPCTANYVLLRTRTKFGERGFCYSGAAAWNSLLSDLHELTDTKTHLNGSRVYFLSVLIRDFLRCHWTFHRAALYKILYCIVSYHRIILSYNAPSERGTEKLPKSKCNTGSLLGWRSCRQLH